MNDQFRTVISVCEYFNNHSYFRCFARLSLSLKRFLSHAINVFLFTVNCKMRTLPARSRGKISVRKQFLSGIMWKAGDWISCYYSQYKAEKASKKKFEDWPRPDGSKTF